MKIEKISDNQIKFILNRSDLEERDINIKELAYGSEKVQELFREMMDRALVKFDFQSENAPLMIEAIPVSGDSIMIIVTKVSSADDITSKLNLFSSESDMQKYREDFIEKKPRRRTKKSNTFLFSFDKLDDVSAASSRLFKDFNGNSSLYKSQNRYFLFIENASSGNNKNLSSLDAILSEYGQKHTSTNFSKQYFVEHGEVIVGASAISVMANL